MSDYKKTLSLPRTKFPMRANLRQKEPELLKFWEKNDVYGKMVEKHADKPDYVLHDGPPYANGHLHMGHALNKIIKDIIVKSRHFMGFRAQYIPGWDCHGLPIELKVEQETKFDKKDIPIIKVRRKCRSYAEKFVKIQRQEFQRMGIFGVWNNPYLTMNPEYESATAYTLGEFVENGSVVRGKKPIHWCISCETALAEAEVEYADHTSPSIFVRFPLTDTTLNSVLPEADTDNTYAVIWTTTPWTLPDNMAVALHPEFEYVLVSCDGSDYIVAKELLESCAEKFGWENYSIKTEILGEKLIGLVAQHPFYDRPSPLVAADYVTLDTGTGLVHTAPGHGREDFETGLRNNLEVLSPIDDEGRFLDVVPYFAGKTIFEANPLVIEKLQEVGHLLGQEKIKHSYPHCWRCKEPVIFRATTQWFISMEKNDLREKALNAIEKDVQWIPSWGRERIHGMIANRPDWCISRQRMWGVPIIALLCKKCDHAYFDPNWVKEIANRFAGHKFGCDYWFEADIKDLVPEGLTCPECGGTEFDKEDDILDVWFDSGTSFAAVLEKRPECRFPADMYLEGSDQHRGWFHSSLLASIGTRGVAPYKSVLTHGYVVDGDGRKMSKSLGNGILPQEIIDQHGAEILRIWVASVNYQDDVRISEEILARLVEAYRRIRNTCRFILGNISDFDPTTDCVADAEMLPLDRYAQDTAFREYDHIQQAYLKYEFHKTFHGLYNMCITDLSAFYLDIIKDRLYVTAPKSLERRSAQTALWRILSVLLKCMAPVLSFTAEEIYQHMPESQRGPGSTVFEFAFEPDQNLRMPEEERGRMDLVADIKTETARVAEPLRKAGDIGHPLDAAVTLYVSESLKSELDAIPGIDLREILIASTVTVKPLEEAPDTAVMAEELEGLGIVIELAPGEKCERCWIKTTERGSNTEHPDVCPRCAAVISTL
ncbi:isoleucine--tRNA ligase [Desulfovibrio inopinatus]|uniref:isoleucine--tRNA ligase n=1 Tax=Desulfovibrio inopinatus TaxID=102109 RepID=UPI0004870B9E|nr:isoleucine--tRNA ligase [Desulfovibrio inopinatus]